MKHTYVRHSFCATRLGLILCGRCVSEKLPIYDLASDEEGVAGRVEDDDEEGLEWMLVLLGRGPIDASGPRLCRESFLLMAMRVLLGCCRGQRCRTWWCACRRVARRKRRRGQTRVCADKRKHLRQRKVGNRIECACGLCKKNEPQREREAFVVTSPHFALLNLKNRSVLRAQKHRFRFFSSSSLLLLRSSNSSLPPSCLNSAITDQRRPCGRHHFTRRFPLLLACLWLVVHVGGSLFASTKSQGWARDGT